MSSSFTVDKSTSREQGRPLTLLVLCKLLRAPVTVLLQFDILPTHCVAMSWLLHMKRSHTEMTLTLHICLLMPVISGSTKQIHTAFFSESGYPWSVSSNTKLRQLQGYSQWLQSITPVHWYTAWITLSLEKQEEKEKSINLLLLTPVQVHWQKASKLQTIKQGRYTRSTLPHADLQEPRGFHRNFSSIANKAEG